MWIYFASDRSGSFQVWKTPSGDSGSVRSAVQVTKRGGNFPEASPDGKFVYFLRGASPFSLWRIPVAGGEETLVLDSQVVDHNYAVTEQGIYFIGDRETATGIALHFFSLAAGKVRSILSIEKHVYGISASADGRRLLFTQLDRFESDLMLVENFR
jgi:Tol biopolymer transport system component